MIKKFKIVAWTVIFFCYIPIIALFINSFNMSQVGDTWQGFTLDWYLEVLHNKELWDACKSSTLVAVFASSISTFIATCSAISVKLTNPKRKFFKNFQKGILKSIFVIPEVQIGVGMMLFFIYTNFNLGIITMILGHCTFCTSYAFDVISSRLDKFDLTIIEAAKDLGADTRTTVLSVILPMSIQAIIASFILSFTISLDDFIISFFISGSETKILTLETYNLIKTGYPCIANCISTIIMTFVFITSYLFTAIVFKKDCPR